MGALFSNVDDLFVWYQALVSGQLVNTNTLATMLTPYPLNSGGQSRHGFGFVVNEVDGHKLAGHGGSHAGWNTFLLFLPDDGIFVAVLTNRSSEDGRARQDAMGIVRLMLEDRGNRSGQHQGQ